MVHSAGISRERRVAAVNGRCNVYVITSRKRDSMARNERRAARGPK